MKTKKKVYYYSNNFRIVGVLGLTIGVFIVLFVDVKLGIIIGLGLSGLGILYKADSNQKKAQEIFSELDSKDDPLLEKAKTLNKIRGDKEITITYETNNPDNEEYVIKNPLIRKKLIIEKKYKFD